MNLTNLFGKQVFALYEGEIVGTVSDAIFNRDLTKVAGLKIFDMEENEFEIKFCSIKAMNDCIIIANKEKLQVYIDRQRKSPMFKTVVTESANLLGKIVDCSINEKGAIEAFVTDVKTNLEPSKLYVRKNFIYYSKTKLLSKNIHPKRTLQELENIKVNILNFNPNQKYENFAPNKLQYNANSIIGKIAKDTLFGANNEIIIKANQVINEKTIEDATRHNRLNQLYFLAN